MNHIEKLIKEMCPNGVEFKELGTLGKRNKGTSITASKMRELFQKNGEIRIFAGGKTFADVSAKSIPKKDIVYEPSIIVKSRGFIGFEYFDKPFSHKSELWSYTINNEKVIQKFVYYFLITTEPYLQRLARATSVKLPQLSIIDTDTLKIPVPPLEVQREIVRILDNFTALEAELEAELEARRKQYEFYRDQLLYADEHGVMNSGVQAKWTTLGEIASYSRTRVQSSKVAQENYVGVDNLVADKKGISISEYLPPNGSLIEFLSENILIGNIRPYLKKIWFANFSGGTNGDVLVIQIHNKDKVFPKFLYHCLASEKFFFYDVKYSKGAKMPRGDKSKILEYPIPLPPLAEQQRIVAILDKFDALVNDISAGLPAEIAARRKQYEFYRDKLLTFTPKAKVKEVADV